MTNIYDNYYQTKNLFGKPLAQLIEFFSNQPEKGKVLDLGCGQGRDAIPISHMGFEVTGIDHSQVGIAQMNRTARLHHLPLIGKVEDIYTFKGFAAFDFILLDSMFHFSKTQFEKEKAFILNIIQQMKWGCQLIFCILDVGEKVKKLYEITQQTKVETVMDKKSVYQFENFETGHTSVSDYRVIVFKK